MYGLKLAQLLGQPCAFYACAGRQHRLHTIIGYDSIVGLAGGRVVEHGAAGWLVFAFVSKGSDIWVCKDATAWLALDETVIFRPASLRSLESQRESFMKNVACKAMAFSPRRYRHPFCF